MQPRILVPILASVMLSAAALAQDAPPAPPAPGAHRMMRMEVRTEDMAQHRAEFCADRYARAVGEMAYLKTRLALSDKQKPLFERWEKIKLESAKTHSGDCADMKPPGMDASLIDKLKLREKMLKERLADLQAQMPSLEALAATLSDEQKHVFERAAMRLREERGEMMDRMRGMHENIQRTIIMRHDGPEDGHQPPAQ